MKTTVDIPDDLFRKLKERAAREGTTIRDLLGAAIRRFLSNRGQDSKPFTLRDFSRGGEGFAPGMEGASWENVRDMIYESSAGPARGSKRGDAA